MPTWAHSIDERARELAFRYAHHIPTIALVWGLFWDTLTLRRPDSLFENATVIGYLALSACAIIMLNLRRARGEEQTSLVLLGFMQFAFGNLMSALIVIFAKSGTLVGSAIFFAVFGALLVGNEFVRDRYSKLHVHIAVWYILLLSYCIIAVPILIGRIGDSVFLISLVASLSVASIFIAALYAIATKDVAARLLKTVSAIGGIAVLMSGLYFTGAIPPAPLMLRQIGVYHDISRTQDGTYHATFEAPYWYELFADTSRTYTYATNTHIFCAGSVFAPTRVQTPIFHRWEYYDEQEKEWLSVARIPFSIRGGRDQGFRGYTEISNLQEGSWRCNIETERGALIGRITFQAVSAVVAPELVETTF